MTERRNLTFEFEEFGDGDVGYHLHMQNCDDIAYYKAVVTLVARYATDIIQISSGAITVDMIFRDLRNDVDNAVDTLLAGNCESFANQEDYDSYTEDF